MSDNNNIAAPTTKPRRLSKQALAKTKRKAHRSTAKIEVRERRYEVRKLRLKGFSPSEIGVKLGVERQIINKDLVAIREEQAGEAQQFDKDQHVVEAGERLDMVDQKAWETYDAAKPGSQTRIKALDLIRLTQGDRTKTMVDTGVIQKEAVKLDVMHTHQLQWDDDMRERVAKSLIEQSLTTKLLEPTPEEDDNIIDVTPVEEDGTLDYETENETETTIEP